MTVDRNEQVIVSYLNAEDKIITTALAGYEPANVDGLASKPDFSWETFEIK